MGFTEGMIAGGAAGVIAEAVLYPIDTIKTRLQASGPILSHFSLFFALHCIPIPKCYRLASSLKRNSMYCSILSLVLTEISFFFTTPISWLHDAIIFWLCCIFLVKSWLLEWNYSFYYIWLLDCNSKLCYTVAAWSLFEAMLHSCSVQMLCFLGDSKYFDTLLLKQVSYIW